MPLETHRLKITALIWKSGILMHSMQTYINQNHYFDQESTYSNHILVKIILSHSFLRNFLTGTRKNKPVAKKNICNTEVKIFYYSHTYKTNVCILTNMFTKLFRFWKLLPFIFKIVGLRWKVHCLFKGIHVLTLIADSLKHKLAL